MCGIYGVFAFRGSVSVDPRALRAMADALRHRGPDGHREWRVDGGTLGVTRLRVVDRDPRADQPFTDPDGRIGVAVNGEIYNADALRRRYASYPFRSRSDAECVVPLVLDRGPDGLRDLDGMFAVTVWDPTHRALTLARDRAGEKPLFYRKETDRITVASELGALLTDHTVPRQLDPTALADFVTDGYLREPHTLLRGVRQVPAGTVLTVTAAGLRATRYWRPEEIALTPQPPDLDRLRLLLDQAVAKQVRADVPVGVFISGGLDSAILACRAVAHMEPEQLTTFCVGFREPSYDERPHARRLARALGVRHIDVEATPTAMRDVLDALVAVGEPIADPAVLPTALLARTARQAVTVVLSGEGGDELFGGYPTYLGHRHAAWFGRLPPGVRRVARRAVDAMPVSDRRVPAGYLLRRFAESADQPLQARHRAWFGSGLPLTILRPGWRTPSPSPFFPDGNRDPIGCVMRADYATALRHRLLVKLDRATMLASLEARAPFLDRDVTTAALSIPGAEHVGPLRTKRVLKRVARFWVPEFALRRGKRGLSVPVGAWLRGPWAAEAASLLDAGRLARQGLLDTRVVARLLEEHRTGRADHGRGLWTLFVLQHWLEHWRPEVTE